MSPEMASAIGDPLERITRLERRVVRERVARREAEQILESKSLELYRANQALSQASADLVARVAELEVEKERVLLAARTDPLTDMANRRAFLDALADAAGCWRQDHQSWCLALLDIRSFRRVNDGLGHAAGDLALQTIGHRLKQVAAPSGLAARLGGDEFALLLATSPEQAPAFLDRLHRVIGEPILVAGRSVRLSAAIGAALAPAHDTEPEALQRFADFALSQSREDPNGGPLLFQPGFRAIIEDRRQMTRDLRTAIQDSAIEPWFQPIIDASSGATGSYEVLARWRRADDSFVPPNTFIPLAEDMGVGRKLDRMLFEQACTMARPWIESGHVTEISINVSPKDLMSPSFVEELKDRLERTRFPGTALVIEVTESIFIADLAAVTNRISRIADLGVRIALDDFGTGYSNLRSLVGLPIDKLKLDRSLISDIGRDPRVATLVSTILQWARALDLRVVAEGVENETQAIILRSLGCSQMQGYLYGRAASSVELSKSFAAR